MDRVDISAIARRLFEAQGAKAIAEAAQKARSFEDSGDWGQAKIWRRVEEALMEMRGPHQG